MNITIVAGHWPVPLLELGQLVGVGSQQLGSLDVVPAHEQELKIDT